VKNLKGKIQFRRGSLVRWEVLILSNRRFATEKDDGAKNEGIPFKDVGRYLSGKNMNSGIEVVNDDRGSISMIITMRRFWWLDVSNNLGFRSLL
jgi:hypothetical protein